MNPRNFDLASTCMRWWLSRSSHCPYHCSHGALRGLYMSAKVYISTREPSPSMFICPVFSASISSTEKEVYAGKMKDLHACV